MQIVVPSAFHKTKMPKYLLNKTSIVPNGLSEAIPSVPNDSCRNLLRFVYASAPNRGLENVLKVWKDIRNHAPRAELRIFYGFSPSKDAQLQRSMGLDNIQYDKWKGMMLKLLQQDGIEYVGEVCFTPHF